jgi:hypothetical protein
MTTDPSGDLKDQGWNSGERRGETETERLDRNYEEILQELRVAQGGVQILFAFLLGIVFTQRFAEVSRFDRALYFGTLLCATVSAALLIAPVAVHRMVFRQHRKHELVGTANVLASIGLAILGLAVIGAVTLVTDVLFGHLAAGLTTGALLAIFAALWLVLPLRIRRRPAEDEA